MRIARILVAWMVIAGMSTSAFAGDLRSSVEKAGKEAGQQEQANNRPMPKVYLWSGTALFVGGMTVGIYAFLKNRNGDVPRFDEATATNKPLGAAGLGLAFLGGTILFLGERQTRRSPTITVGPGRVSVSKQLTW